MDEPPLSDANRSTLTLLRDQLARIDDPRQAGSIKHQLADVLGCALCAMICGFGDFCAMATFARYRLDWLRHFLPLENGAPSHDTFRNVFMAIRPADAGTEEVAHGRYEKRECWVEDDLSFFGKF